MHSLLVALFLQAAAPAPELEVARRLYQTLRYQEALAALAPLLGHASSNEERAQVYLLAGLCHAQLDETEQARARFRDALTLDPTVVAPALTSPKIRAELDRLRAEVAPRVEPGTPPPTPPEPEPVLAKPPPLAPPPEAEAPAPRRWKLPATLTLGIVALASGAVAVGMGLDANASANNAREAKARDTFVTEIDAYNSRAERSAVISNVLWVTAALAVVTAVLFAMVF